MQHKTISELHEMLASKAITPLELVEESLNLAKKYTFLNCFNFINKDRAINQAKKLGIDADGPLPCDTSSLRDAVIAIFPFFVYLMALSIIL